MRRSQDILLILPWWRVGPHKGQRLSYERQTPPEHHNKVIFAHLKSSTIEFSATDWLHPARTPKQGNTVCLYINGGKYDELKAIFDKLAVVSDQRLLDDLRYMPFASYGHLADKYGIHWFFQGDMQ
jgi:PhnB protein